MAPWARGASALSRPKNLPSPACLLHEMERQADDRDREGQQMKVTVDVDCTPAEARAFLGLPDVSPIHDKYIKTMLDSMDGIGSVEQMETLFKSFSPMGDAGVRLFKQMMDIGLSGMAGKNGDKKD